MNSPARPLVSTAHRARVLRALGITPWTRRAPVRAPAPDDTAQAAVEVVASGACVVVLGEHNSTRELDLLGRALNAGGATWARAARVTVRDGQLPGVPAASAYLVFGAAQAHALGRSLPVEVMQSAQIMLVDDLAQVLTDAGAKRRLWSALRRLRQTLATTAGR